MRTLAPEGFDWLVTLTELKEGKEFNTDQYIELCHLAQSWPTCACGQLCRLLPRRADGCPQDTTLRDLGCRFYELVKNRKWCVALEIFKHIECRSTQLLREQREVESQDSWVSACVWCS
jgi:hypothetical protein